MTWIVLNSSAVFFAVLLVFAYAAAYINPERFVWFAYFGKVFPILLVINILFAVFLAFNLKKAAVLSLFAIGLNGSNIQTMARFKSAEFDTNEKKIRVMSYNVNLFDYYGHINTEKGQTQREILNFIASETPDIICFQEFREDSRNAVVTPFLAQRSDLRYASQSRYNQNISFGNKIYSKFPILHDSLIRFENSTNMVLFADILAYGDTIRVFNFHLESIGFQESDDAFYRELTTAPTEVSDIKKGLGNLLRKINKAYLKRAEQARLLARLIADSPYPTLVCGDMNDTPTSYTYRQISKKLHDSFRKRGFGLGTSYSGVYPSFRIDYIFFSERFYCENFTTIRVKYSDHFPICSDLKINN